MAKTLDQMVQDVLGAQLMQIIQLQVQLETMAERLKSAEARLPVADPPPDGAA